MKVMRLSLVGCCLAFLALPLRAQEAQAPVGGFRGEFLAQMADLEQKIVSLAEAVPQEKYDWRPGEGVRSVSDVYMHLAGGNYFFLSMIGAKPPARPKNAEKTAIGKQDVVKALKESFDFTRKFVMEMKDDDLEKEATMFGSKTVERNVLFTLGLHMHEHLGQSIAYARTCGVVPPWSKSQ